MLRTTAGQVLDGPGVSDKSTDATTVRNKVGRRRFADGVSRGRSEKRCGDWRNGWPKLTSAKRAELGRRALKSGGTGYFIGAAAPGKARDIARRPEHFAPMSVIEHMGEYRTMALKNIAPPDPKRLDDPKHWPDKAEEARAKAEDMADADARETMEHVAEEYDELADRVERQRRESGAVAAYSFR